MLDPYTESVLIFTGIKCPEEQYFNKAIGRIFAGITVILKQQIRGFNNLYQKSHMMKKSGYF